MVDVEKVRDRAAGLPNVVVSRTNMFMCSDPGQNFIIEDIENEGLEPRHSSLMLAQTARDHLPRSPGAGGVEPVSLREREHPGAGELGHRRPRGCNREGHGSISAAVAKSARLGKPLDPIRIDTTARAAVIGAGVAGLRAARDLAHAGLEVSLIERKRLLGGNVAVLDRLYPNEEAAADVVSGLAENVLQDERSLSTPGPRWSAPRATWASSLYGRAGTGRDHPGCGRSQGRRQGLYHPFEGYSPMGSRRRSRVRPRSPRSSSRPGQ